jgi:protein TonB
METYRNDPFDSGQSSRKGVVLAVIVGFHVLLVWALNSSLSRIVTERVFGPIETEIIEEMQEEPDEPPPPPPMVETPPPFVPPPDIIIDLPASSGSTTAITSVTNVARPAAPPPPPQATVRIAAKPDARLFKSDRWKPEMPPSVQREAKKAGDLGATVLRCVVNTEGKCERVDVLQASPIPKLDETAVKHALRVWKFSPATEDGKPVVSNYDLKITWRVLD